MTRLIAAVVLVLALAGCTCRERYAPWLEQLEEDLRDDVRPKYEEALTRRADVATVRSELLLRGVDPAVADAALAKGARKPELVENDLILVDRAIDSIHRVREGGPDAAASEAAP